MKKTPVPIPIIIGAPKPFRFVARDASDRIEFDLDHINNRTYDNIRLHRATRFFGTKEQRPFLFGVGFNGAFFLPWGSDYDSPKVALDQFNRIMASLMLGGLRFQGIGPEDLGRGILTTEGYFRFTETYGGNSQTLRELANRSAGAFATLDLIDTPTIMADDLENAYIAGRDVLNAIGTVSPVLLIGATTRFLSSQLEESLSHCWICIEQLVSDLWNSNVIASLDGDIRPGRKKFLQSNQWRAAHKVELLQRVGLIDDETSHLLEDARKARNLLLHDGKPPEEDTVISGLRSLSRLIQGVCHIKDVAFDPTIITHLTDKRVYVPSPVVVPIDSDGSHTRLAEVTSGITRVSGQVYSRALFPIPGEPGWEGGFEEFDDIRFVSIGDNSEESHAKD